MSEPRLPVDPNAPDGEHDAWLREALRHAPDAALSPPTLLREKILSQARAAVEPIELAAAAAPVRPRRRPEPTNAFAAFWSWLAQPPVAAGFASVMAATLVGLMWWDRPMDEAMPQPQPPVVAARPEAADAAPAATVADAQTQAPASPRAASHEATSTPPAAVTKRAAAPAAELREKSAAPAGVIGRATPVPFPAEAKEERAVDPAAARDASKKDEMRAATDLADDSARKSRAQVRSIPAATDSVAAATAPVTQAEPAQPAPAMSLPAPAAARAPAPAPALSPAPPVMSAAPAPAAAPRSAAAVVAPPAARDAEANAFSGAPARGRSDESVADRRSEAATSAAKLERQGAAAKPQAPPGSQAAPAPLSPWLALLDADPGRGTRVGNGGRAVPVDDALLRWLGSLDAATRGRWLALESPADRAGTALDLHVDGQAAATLSIEASTVTLSTRTGATQRLWRAEIGAAAADRLRNSLPRLPP